MLGLIDCDGQLRMVVLAISAVRHETNGQKHHSGGSSLDISYEARRPNGDVFTQRLDVGFKVSQKRGPINIVTDILPAPSVRRTRLYCNAAYPAYRSNGHNANLNVVKSRESLENVSVEIYGIQRR